MMQAALFKLSTPFRVLGAILLLTSAVAFVAACGAHELYTVDSVQASTGFFKICLLGQCATIDKDCSGTLMGNDFQFDDCGKWNAARAFAVMAILLTSAAAIIALINICKKGFQSGAVVVLGVLGAVVCGIVSMAIAYQYKKDFLDTYDYGASADLLVAGWVLGLLGSVLFFFGAKGSEYNALA